MFSPWHTAMAARAFSTLNSPGMVRRNSRWNRRVRTRNRMSLPRLRTWLAYTSASSFFWEKVMTGRPPSWAAWSTRWAWSQSRFTQAMRAWAKIFSLEEK